jgi:Heterokaryon incompatibility protein (HET)
VFVWIDSLCINQDDMDEKSLQVRLMGEIYSKAQQVLICLGEPTLENYQAMDFIFPLRNAIMEATKAAKDPSLVLIPSILLKGGFDASSSSWIALSKFLSLPWFTRIWVVQEVAVASNPVFICGDRAVTWDDLQYVTFKMFQYSLTMLLKSNPNDRHQLPLAPLAAMSFLSAMGGARAVKQQQKSNSLQEALIQLHHFNATDPRDKIFALLGLATDAEDAVLNPDYNASVEEVYTNTALYLLQRDASILILHSSGIGRPRKYKDLPSWVPRWDYSIMEDPIIFGSRQSMKYNAASNTISSVRPAGGRIIMIDGIVVDAIENFGRESGNLSSLHDIKRGYKIDGALFYIAWLEEAETLTKSLRSDKGTALHLYPGGKQTWPEAYWRTVIANGALDKPAPAKYGEYFEISKQMMRSIGTVGLEDPEIFQKSLLFIQAFAMATKNRSILYNEKWLHWPH